MIDEFEMKDDHDVMMHLLDDYTEYASKHDGVLTRSYNTCAELIDLVKSIVAGSAGESGKKLERLCKKLRKELQEDFVPVAFVIARSDAPVEVMDRVIEELLFLHILTNIEKVNDLQWARMMCSIGARAIVDLDHLTSEDRELFY